MTDYKPQQLDKKWQQRWTAARAFEVDVDPKRPKFYCLEMFAYPSGHAHVGHVRNYIIGDVMARMKRMRGFNVLHPFGWDAFGLPAENAAIKTGTHPEKSTLDNIAHMKGQLQRLGISYAWEREIATCLPEYYKFNQWIFLKMFERGLAYRKRSTVNWCPSCQTVLANEQVVDGACWRCGTTVVRARPRAVVLPDHRLRRRAAEGPRDAHRVARESRRDAAQLDRALGRRARQVSGCPVGAPGARRRSRSSRRASTPSTAPPSCCSRPSIRWSIGSPPRAPTRRRSAAASPGFARSIARRGSPAPSRRKASTPAARRSIRSPAQAVPIWIANFVLAEYGTGAIMAVPAHDQRDFEFARKYDLPITSSSCRRGRARRRRRARDRSDDDQTTALVELRRIRDWKRRPHHRG